MRTLLVVPERSRSRNFPWPVFAASLVVVIDPKTVLDPEGRFQQDVFNRLRRERDDKPIVLAE